MSNSSRHFIPAARRVKGFPFSFTVKQLPQTDDNNEIIKYKPVNKGTFLINTDDLRDAITDVIIPAFDFHKYLDEESEYNIVKYPDKSPTYVVEMTGYSMVQESKLNKETGVMEKVFKEVKGRGKGKGKVFKEPKLVKEVVVVYTLELSSFRSEYNYTLIKSLDQLQRVVTGAKRITHDVETSGLDPEFDVIAGINFSVCPKKGYYLPLAHAKEYTKYNIDKIPALDIFYNALKQAERVYMFNSRFDMRFMEYFDAEIDSTGTNICNKRYDMRDIKLYDAQLMMYFADPDWKRFNMDWAEKHFLGLYRPDLKETLNYYGLKTFDTTKIDPTKLLFYAGQDGITTYQLGETTYQYQEEFGTPGAIDASILYPLMDMENRLVKLDTKYLEEQTIKIRERLTTILDDIHNSIGYNINLNSSPQRIKLFESFGLDTGERTDTGNMSTGTDAVNAMIEAMENREEDIPSWLRLLGEQSKLSKLNSTFFGSLLEQASYRNGRVRLNYRHGRTGTGRFSSGEEK